MPINNRNFVRGGAPDVDQALFLTDKFRIAGADHLQVPSGYGKSKLKDPSQPDAGSEIARVQVVNMENKNHPRPNSKPSHTAQSKLFVLQKQVFDAKHSVPPPCGNAFVLCNGWLFVGHR